MKRADILVIGAGPAGIAAAVSAAGSGRSVLVVDESPAPGGQIWRGAASSGSARRWKQRFAASGAEFLGNTTIVDAPAARTFVAERAGEPIRLHAGAAVIIAAGARELFLPFPGWTLPGVIGVGGAQALLKRGWGVAGLRVVVSGSGPLLLAVAAALHGAGAVVFEVVEQAPAANVRRFARSLWTTPSRLAAGAHYRWSIRHTRYSTSTWVRRAEGAGSVRAVTLSDGRALDCDVLCTGYGLVPSTELARMIGCAATTRGVSVDELQRTSVDAVYCAGEATGIAGMEAAIVEGRIAGLAAAGASADIRDLAAERARHAAFAGRMRIAFALRPELSRLTEPGTLICRCEDVTFGAIAACESFREARLHTRLGMGACQGRICGAALRHLRGWSDDSARPPAALARVSTLMHTHETDGTNAEG